MTSTLSYDALNRLVVDSTSSTSEWYLYDAGGNRVLKRSTSGSSTSLTVYAFGLQELTYTSSGTFASQLDYYSIAGHLIASSNGSSLTYDVTDAEGSVLLTFSGSAVLGEQAYGPYGNQRYTKGTIGTDKGYTGQFQDALTGLDYYNARYYDPVVGVFLSVDTVQGNAQGMDPYAYVGGNPETRTDASGQRYIDGKGDYGNSDPQGNLFVADQYPLLTSTTGYIYQTFFYPAKIARQPVSKGDPKKSLADDLGIPTLQSTWSDPNVPFWQKVGTTLSVVGDDAGNIALGATFLFGGAEFMGGDAFLEGGAFLADTSEPVVTSVEDLVASCGAGLSFAARTPVATDHGEQAIGTMRVGEQVWSYNPQTKHMELEPI